LARYLTDKKNKIICLVQVLHEKPRVFVHGFVLDFVHGFVHLFVHDFVHDFVHGFVHDFVHLFVHDFVHSGLAESGFGPD
jgi:hypothetical protein